VDGDEKVVQVTWSRQKPGGEREQIITGHFTDGPKGKQSSQSHKTLKYTINPNTQIISRE